MRTRAEFWLFVCLAGFAFALPPRATACRPVFSTPHGFPLREQDRFGIHLPANARGITFMSATSDGSPVPVSSSDFLLTDTYGRRLPVRVEPATKARDNIRFLISPDAGFVAGERYALKAPQVHAELNGHYAAEVSISVGAALPAGALARDATIITGRSTEVLLQGESAEYASQVERTVTSDTIPFQTDCDALFTSSVRAAPGCHVVKASLSFPEVDDRAVRLAALVCGRWLVLPLPTSASAGG